MLNTDSKPFQKQLIYSRAIMTGIHPINRLWAGNPSVSISQTYRKYLGVNRSRVFASAPSTSMLSCFRPKQLVSCFCDRFLRLKLQ